MAVGIVLARLLSPEVFGHLVFVTASVNLMMIPLNISSSQVLVTDGGRTPGLFSKVMGLAAVTMALKLLVLCLFVVWQLLQGNRESAIVAFLVGLPVALTDWLDVLRSDLEGRGEFRPNFLAQFSSFIVHAVFAVGLVLAGMGIYGLAIAALVAFLPQLVIYLSAGGRKPNEINISPSGLRSQLHVGWWLWLSSTCASVLLRVDKFVLGLFGGEIQLGYYNRALNYSPFSMLAMGSLLTNASVVAIKQQNERAAKIGVLGKLLGVMAAGAAFNWIILHFFSDPLVIWIFGPHWEGSIPAFEAFAWLSLAYIFYYLPLNALLAVEAYRSLAVGRMIGLILFAGLLWWLAATNSVSAVSVAYAFSAGMALTGLLTAVAWALAKGSTGVPQRK